MGLLTQLLAPTIRRSPAKASFAGSLDYIRRLPTKKPLAITKTMVRRGRDITIISNGFKQYSKYPLHVAHLGESSGFRMVGDGRAWHPAGRNRPMLAFIRDAGDEVVIPEPDWKRIDRAIEKAKKRIYEGSPLYNLYYKRPNALVECIKRKMRREVLGAYGVFGKVVNRPKYRPESKVRC